MPHYQIAPPGFDPLTSPRCRPHRGRLALWVLIGVAGIAVVLLLRYMSAGAAALPKTGAPEPASISSPTAIPATPTHTATSTNVPTQTPYVITRVVTYPPQLVEVTREREVTRIVEMRWPVPVTQIVEQTRLIVVTVIITATPRPTSTVAGMPTKQ